MTDPSGDPVYQLNAVLWMLQPGPASSSAVNAVLNRRGYSVRSLGQSLTADPDLERQLAVDLDLRGAPAPDVLASAPASDPWPVFECKRSSFSPDSSTSRQASKILARSADLSLAVGSPPGRRVDGCTAYVTRDAEAPALQATLDALGAALNSAGITPAPACTVGLRVETGVGLIARIASGELPGAAGEALADDVVVLPAAGPEEDARPLYLVPFDPGVEQDPYERSLCLRILLARGQSHAASVLGRGPAPGTAVLEGHDLLDAATYGLSKYWRDSESRERAGHEILRFVKAALSSLRKKAPMVVEGSGPKRLEVAITSAEHRQDCAEAVMAHALPGDPELSETWAPELPFADE